MNNDTGDFKRDNFIKQQQQLKAMKPTGSSKILSADSMIEDLLSKKETFQKKTDASAMKAQTGPLWLNPDNLAAVHPIYTKIWEMVKIQSSATAGKPQELADTSLVSPLLMTSGLSTDMLGFIWSLANNTIPGALIQTELYSVLALVALAQSGYIFNSITVLNQLPQPPLPNLNISMLVQMKSNFSAGSEAAVMQSPIGISSSNSIAVGQTVGAGYFNQYPTAAETTCVPPGNIVPLDVNNLQSAASLTLPSNFGYSGTPSSLHSLQQSFGLMQQGFGTPGVPGGGAVPVQSVAPNVPTPQSTTSSTIPSISLGLSQPMATLNQPTNGVGVQQSHSKVGTLVPPVNDTVIQTAKQFNFTSGINFPVEPSFNVTSSTQAAIDRFDVVFSSSNVRPAFGSNPNMISSRFSQLNLDDRADLPNADRHTKDDQSEHNVDESFDSLSTERALSNANKFTTTASHSNENKILKPNYNVSLFDSYEDVKSIFPVDGCKETAGKNDEGGNDSLIMHNPIYSTEECAISKFDIAPSVAVDFALNARVSNLQAESSAEDDFTDFQSADFTAFNNFGAVTGTGEVSDTFSDFQQATVVPSGALKPFNNTVDNANCAPADEDFVKRDCKVGAHSNTNDDDLFPSLNLKLNNLSTSVKVPEVSDSLSIKSIDISIISSGNNTGGDSSPISNDYNSQENGKVDSTVFSQANVSVDNNYKDDKVFLSLSSSLVFDNSKDNLQTVQSGGVINDASQSYVLHNTSNIQPEQVGDKYSALRMLEVSSDAESKDNVDDFGDFVAAEPEQLQLPDASAVPPDSSMDSRSAEVKCLEACLNILEKSYEILKSASTPDVLSQILSDPRGSEHLSCVLEVYKVSERLMQHPDCKSTPLASRVQAIWDLLLVMVPDIIASYQKQMEENLGPKCGVCKCNYGPTPVRYGLNYYHPPCANLYLRYVSPLLPSVPI